MNQAPPYMSLPEISEAVESLPRQIGHFEFKDKGHIFRANGWQEWICIVCGTTLLLEVSGPCTIEDRVEAFHNREAQLAKESHESSQGHSCRPRVT